MTPCYNPPKKKNNNNLFLFHFETFLFPSSIIEKKQQKHSETSQVYHEGFCIIFIFARHYIVAIVR